MIEKSLLINIGGYDENFYFSQDYKLFYDCLVMGYKVPIIKKVLYKLNMKDNLSNKFKNFSENKPFLFDHCIVLRSTKTLTTLVISTASSFSSLIFFLIKPVSEV
mgnify:CR=1 FL=1